jgi:hypothetical protein
MIYLFPTGDMRYVCFCGANIGIKWIDEHYNFDEKHFKTENKITRLFNYEPKELVERK